MKTSFLLLLTLVLFTSCRKEQAPYSQFKSVNYTIISDENITVNLDDQYTLIVHSGFEISDPKYYLQKNGEVEQGINDSTFVEVESHGWNGRESLYFETIRILLHFDSNSYNAGDQVSIRSQHQGVNETITFVIN